jgi:hypothetical protein
MKRKSVMARESLCVQVNSRPFPPSLDPLERTLCAWAGLEKRMPHAKPAGWKVQTRSEKNFGKSHSEIIAG